MCWSPQLLLERLCIARLLDAVLEVEGWYTQLHLVSSSANAHKWWLEDRSKAHKGCIKRTDRHTA